MALHRKIGFEDVFRRLDIRDRQIDVIQFHKHNPPNSKSASPQLILILKGWGDGGGFARA